MFLFQPLSAREMSSHRRWALASLTQTPGEEEWQTRYQSPTERTRSVITYRPHMANASLPPMAPMDDRYTYEWTDPLSGVWFPATTPLNGLYSPPPCLNPVTHITEVMQRANTARVCGPPRLWHGLLTYHAVSENATNPVGA